MRRHEDGPGWSGGRRWEPLEFADRADAGRRLAERLDAFAHRDDVVVLALPRGGVPVAFEVARSLHAPLDIVAVRKLGLPYQPELAMGAIGEGDVRVLNDEVVRMAGVAESEIASVEQIERQELDRRARTFREGRPAVDLAGRNLLNKRYPVRGFYFGDVPPNFPNEVYIQLGDPRTWLLSVSARFGNDSGAR